MAPAQLQAEKAEKYDVVGGGLFYLQGDNRAQSMPGAGVRPSKLHELMVGIFGNQLKGHALTRALRDVLHLDQAHQNDVDVFVTNDRRLLEASAVLEKLGIQVEVQTPSECLAKIEEYFKAKHGTSEVERLRETVRDHGPIVLGSNSSYDLSIIERQYGESLIKLQISEGYLLIAAKLRGSDGQMLIELSPGAKPVIHDRESSLTEVGRGPLRPGENSTYQFVAWHCNESLLAARTTRTGRVIFNRMTLRNRDGNLSVHVDKETLSLQNVWFGP